MNIKLMKILTFSLLALTVLAGVGFVVYANNQSTEIANYTAALNKAKDTVTNGEEAKKALVKEIDKNKEDVKLLENLLEEKAVAIKAITEFKTVATEAEGKVDYSDEKNQVKAAQTALLTAETVDAIASQIETVTSATMSLKTKVEEFNFTQQAERVKQETRTSTSPSQTNNSNPSAPEQTGDWLGELRSILNNVGGGHIGLSEYDGNCGGGYSDACSSSNGEIFVTKTLASKSYGTKVWAMTHELAHQYQFKSWGSISSAPEYQNLFGGDIEKLANCMAVARGNGGGISCSQAQIDWAGQIWNW